MKRFLIFKSLKLNRQCPFTNRLSLYSTNVVDCKNDKSSLKLIIQDPSNSDEQKVLKFNALWLRFNCHSPSSKQPNSGQITIQKDAIPSDLNIESVRIIGSDLIIKWNEASKQENSVLPIEFLVNNCPTDGELSTRKTRFKTSQNLKFFDYRKFFGENQNSNNLEIFNWMKRIAEYGVCIVKNAGTENETVKKIAELIAPVQRHIYGEIFEVKVDKCPINIAYSSAGLHFHIDLNYYESPPGLQFLHCIRFDSAIEGGESIFCDLFNVAENFRDEYPEDFENLATIPATFQKIHFNRERPVCMIYRRPHIVLNQQNQIIGVNWAPPFEGPLKNPDEKKIEKYYKSYLKFSKFIDQASNVLEHKLEPGEVAVFNNRRVLHGRREFSNNGIRHFQGCYVNIDEFKSEVLASEYRIMKKLDVQSMKSAKWYDIDKLELGKLAYGNNDNF